MNFTDPNLKYLLEMWAASTDDRERAEMHNISFEERLDQHRLDDFERSVTSPCADHLNLRRQISDFVTTYVEVATPHVPATFQTQNSSASMREMSPEQKLLRIENITRHLANSGFTLTGLEESLSSTGPAHLAKSQVFLDQWNLARDNRPTFAAFKDQLLPEIADDAWPHRLRDRLGLAHYSAAGGPVVVALIEYTVDEVLSEARRSPDIVHPFCVPTFLDSKPSSQFFPTPRELPAGAPMALFEIWSDDELIVEVLHSRLTYHSQHIVKLGEITSDGPEFVFRSMRDNHLAALQLAAERDDFGEEL